MEKRFKVGETVIALSDPSGPRGQPRKKGGKYIVQATSYCCGCGEQVINIGPKVYGSIWSQYVGCRCGSKQPHNGLGWTRSTHFARPEELEAEMQEAVESETYEHAAILRDLMNTGS